MSITYGNNTIYDYYLQRILSSLNINLEKIIICLDPLQHDVYYKKAIEENKVFIMSYLSYDYGFFNVSYPKNIIIIVMIYILKI